MKHDYIAPLDCTDYRCGVTDLEHFGSYYPPLYFTRTSPPFHQRLDIPLEAPGHKRH